MHKVRNSNSKDLLTVILKSAIALNHCGVEILEKKKSFLVRLEHFNFSIDLGKVSTNELKILYNFLLKQFLLNHIGSEENNVPYFYFYRLNITDFIYKTRKFRYLSYKRNKIKFDSFFEHEKLHFEYYIENDTLDTFKIVELAKNEYNKFIKA